MPDVGAVFNEASISNSKFEFRTAEEWRDPTEKLDMGGELLLEPEETELREWFGCLQARRLIVMNCFDDEYVGQCLLHLRDRLNGTEIRYANPSLTVLGRDLSFNDLLDKRIAEGSPCLVFVPLEGLRSSAFIDSLPRDTYGADAASRRLRDAERYVVVRRLRASQVLDPSGRRVRGGPLVSFDVDSRRAWLRHYYPENHEALYAELRRQLESDLWGEGEAAAWESFQDFLRAGQLREEIERQKRRRSASERDEERSVEEIAEGLIRPGEVVGNAVLFTATFFSDLPADEFERVVLTLLGREMTEKKYFKEKWPEELAAVLERCHLRIDRWPAGGSIFESGAARLEAPRAGFTVPGLKRELEKAFWGPRHFVFTQLFERVWAERLLLGDHEGVVQGALELMLRVARANPSRHGRDWLVELVRMNLRRQKVAANLEHYHSGLDASAAFSDEQIMELLDRSKNGREKIFRALYSLLREMYTSPRLRETVDNFLYYLIEKRLHGHFHELICRLYDVPDLDPFEWWRRMLDDESAPEPKPEEEGQKKAKSEREENDESKKSKESQENHESTEPREASPDGPEQTEAAEKTEAEAKTFVASPDEAETGEKLEEGGTSSVSQEIVEMVGTAAKAAEKMIEKVSEAACELVGEEGGARASGAETTKTHPARSHDRRVWDDDTRGGEVEIGVLISEKLFELANSSSSHLRAIMERVGSWLCEPSTRPVKLSSRFAARLLSWLFVRLTLESRLETATGPSSSPVLDLLVGHRGDAPAAGENDVECPERLLSSVLLDPGLELELENEWEKYVLGCIASALDRPDVEGLLEGDASVAEEIFTQRLVPLWRDGLAGIYQRHRLAERGYFPKLLQAILLAEWVAELFGADPAPKTASAVYDRLLGALAEHLERGELRLVKHYWSLAASSRSAVLSAVSDRVALSSSRKRREYKQLRRRLSSERRAISGLKKDCPRSRERLAS